ncbi:hypothetical protein [Streptomyces sp. NRRL S-337]|uniref:hypothetical protein n=1 Tax=Streptomyces sp. NRRL S-337 TaxID=1463900 RepID=UPI0004C872CA|nr:hypothetical protein [Streptomyces sp. NRRL S-337]
MSGVCLPVWRAGRVWAAAFAPDKAEALEPLLAAAGFERLVWVAVLSRRYRRTWRGSEPLSGS